MSAMNEQRIEWTRTVPGFSRRVTTWQNGQSHEDGAQRVKDGRTRIVVRTPGDDVFFKLGPPLIRRFEVWMMMLCGDSIPADLPNKDSLRCEVWHPKRLQGAGRFMLGQE